MDLRALEQVLAGEVFDAETRQQIARRAKELREGLSGMFAGIGLAFFFYFFFGGSIGFAAIGAMVFFIGLGRVLSAMLWATPALRIEWRLPSMLPDDRLEELRDAASKGPLGTLQRIGECSEIPPADRRVDWGLPTLPLDPKPGGLRDPHEKR